MIVNLSIPGAGAQQGITSDSEGTAANGTKLDCHINTCHEIAAFTIDRHLENPTGCGYEPLNKKNAEVQSAACCNFDKQRNAAMGSAKLVPESDSFAYEKLNRATMESSLPRIASERVTRNSGSDWYEKPNKDTMESIL